MSDPASWIQEARRRHRVTVHLHDQGHYRDAISRVYYALVAAVQGLLLTVDSQLTSHPGLKNQLGLHFVKTNTLPREVSDIFEMLRQHRNEADYEMRFFSRKQTEQSLDAADRVIKRTEAVMS